MQKSAHILVILSILLFGSLGIAQNDSIQMSVKLDHESRTLHIQQKITYFNTSDDVLKEIYLHNWANAFSDKHSHLGKRFIENYSKKFFFAKEKNRGFSSVNTIRINDKDALWGPKESNEDYLIIQLDTPLQPKESVAIDLDYKVRIPLAKFTKYGYEDCKYNLRYWHIVPVVYNGKWQLMHHLDMDDQFQNPTNYLVSLDVPKALHLATNLQILEREQSKYVLQGNNMVDFEVSLSKESSFNTYQTEATKVVTNLNNIDVDASVKTNILNRQLLFIKTYLGEYPHKKILVNKISYDKNPLYGFNQLPGFLSPFSDTFEWDMRMFKTMSKYYIDHSIGTHTRTDNWLREGVHSYLMLRYVEKYYPEIKLIGGISKMWGVRTYHVSELDFNERYALTFQFASRKNHDQALNTPADSLTNFNRLILNRFKSGIGLRYLDEYIGDSLVDRGIKKYFSNRASAHKTTRVFKDFVVSESKKDVNWFFNDYIGTDKKIDYKIKHIKSRGDSVAITIKNKRNFSAPIALYSLNKKKIQSKTWLTAIDSTETIIMPKGVSKRWMLNYKGITPEINLKDNWETDNKSMVKKPLRFRLLRDAEDPYHNQFFIEPKYGYNFYDGVILASTISNKAFFKKEFEYAVTPSYGFKSNALTGHFKTIFWKYLENEKINSYRLGLVGSYYHYQENLAYKKLTPYVQVFFKRKNPRSVKSSSLSMNYAMVSRDVNVDDVGNTEANNYNVFSLGYVYNNPEIINNFRFSTNLEFSSKFSKLYSDVRFRKLTNSNRQLQARFFSGVFLYNKATTDFFSFGVNRPNDYLFKYRYYGRSETTGVLSQQFIMNDGGFKANMPMPFANQWITSLNTSVGIWRWIEVYADIGFVKNKHQSVHFIHDKGVRLNFVNDILEVYFPIHSTNGWETSNPDYKQSIRFVLTSDVESIYAFLRRGFM